MVKRTRTSVPLTVGLLLMALAGCGGDDEKDAVAKPVDGTFVGKVAGTEAFVAVVASPAAKGNDRRDVQVYVSDGKALSEWFPGSVQDNGFTAKSDDGDAKAQGKLGDGSVTGSVVLPDGKTVRYTAGRATGASGLYDLKVASDGKLSGASAAGVGVTGKPRKQGIGTLKLADGRRRKFNVTDSGGEAVRLQAAQVRMILLPDGQLRGAGKKNAGGDSDYFIRSSAS